jgi:energy-coupling factor transporter ATP-binding protein EcfA2
MRLKNLKYSDAMPDSGQRWTLTGLELGARNLIVGKNASGKSRTINVINGLARQLAGLAPLAFSANYDVTFVDDADVVTRYEVRFTNASVDFERLTVGNFVKLDRGVGGAGKIWADEVQGGTDILFQVPPNQLAALFKQDTIQHKFLEPLNQWASSVRFYPFGSALGKEFLGLFIEGGPKPDERDFNQVMGLYRLGFREFGEPFNQAILGDLNSVGYDAIEIGTCAPVTIQVNHTGPGEIMALFVRERDLGGVTDQWGMSQGMYRVLALFVHVNYCQFRGSAGCVLIDDIGEGLDFERSCALIERLRDKTKDGKIQLVLTTNDRFVMNRVPLEEWSVLQRKGGDVTVRNNQNSHEIFEEFKFTGLSNFSFLETDMLAGTTPIARPDA